MIRLSIEEGRRVSQKLQVAHLRMLRKFGLQWSYSEGERCLIMFYDHVGAAASKVVPNFYPPAVAQQLYHKSTVTQFLGMHGFPVLQSREVSLVSDITLDDTNFILKPIHQQGGIYEVNDPVGYRVYADKAELTAKFTREELHRAFLKGYILQEADMRPVTREVVLRGTVNMASQVYWCRDTVMRRENGRVREADRLGWGGFLPEKALIEGMIAATGIKAAGFMLVLIEMPNMQLYPLDWGFRLGGLFVNQIIDHVPQELERALAHQFDVATTLPDQFPGRLKSTGDWLDPQPINLEIL